MKNSVTALLMCSILLIGCNDESTKHSLISDGIPRGYVQVSNNFDSQYLHGTAQIIQNFNKEKVWLVLQNNFESPIKDLQILIEMDDGSIIDVGALKNHAGNSVYELDYSLKSIYVKSIMLKDKNHGIIATAGV